MEKVFQILAPSPPPFVKSNLMGRMIDGKWTLGEFPVDAKGRFQREPTAFHHQITADGSSGFKAEAGRYHLYVSFACPWSHRTLIGRSLKGLEKVIGLSVVDPLMEEEGWAFTKRPGCIPDPFFKASYLREVYAKADSQYTGRVTVPVLWDQKKNTIVNNDSREIIRMLGTQFEEFGNSKLDLCPKDLKEEIDKKIDEIYNPLNNGVYRCGFAKSQSAYDEAVEQLFSALESQESLLAGKAFLCGDRLTEADICLFVTLFRFDPVYHFHFKCNVKRLRDFPRLWDYLWRIYKTPGVAETCHPDHIKQHYFQSHRSVNPYGIVPKGPEYFEGWKKLQEGEEGLPLYQGHFLNLKGVQGWEYASRSHGVGAVAIVALTDQDKVLLVEQYRLPVQKKVLELPAGLVNDQQEKESETSQNAADRELFEETGYHAKRWTPLMGGPVSPGLSDERIDFYLAQGLEKRGEGGGDATEDIRVHEVPKNQIFTWLAEKQKAGYEVDPKIFAGLYFLDKSKVK